MGSVAGLVYEILFNCPLSAATTGSEVGNTLSGGGHTSTGGDCR
ncbi:hypothetical protein [Nocardia stercoris]|nr:hypothetical protein [Nocardia stercoris]